MSNKKLFCVFILFLIPRLVLAENFSPADYAGKIIYLDFWASWCGPCRQSFPWMNNLASRFDKNDFVVVAVNLDQEKNLAETFIQELNPSFKILFDDTGKMAETFGVSAMPSSVILDRTGKIRFTHRGFTKNTKNSVETEIQTLLAE